MPTHVELPKPQEKKDKKEKNRIIQNVTFFGDSAIPEEDPIFKSVYETAKLLAEKGFVIVNGGGPGLMKAATDGAEEVKGETSLVYWEPTLASFFEGKNLANVGDHSEAESNYVMRTFGLIEQGDVYIVCKGGTGTVSEFGLVWALAKLYYGVHKPVILFGDFWQELIDAFSKAMYLDELELGVLYFATTPEEVLDIIENHEKKIDKSKLKKTNGSESAFLLSEKTSVTVDSYEKHGTQIRSHRTKTLPSQEQLDEFISLVKPPAKVLDIGSGIGLDAGYLSEKYAVTGIELSERLAEIARFENPNVNIIQDDLLNVDFGIETYKGIWSRDAIHHIENKDLPGLFEKISGALVEGGVFYVIVREGEGEYVDIEKKRYGDMRRYYNLFTPEKLIKLTSDAGLRLKEINDVQRSHKWLSGIFVKE